jgi:hypothetical protein
MCTTVLLTINVVYASTFIPSMDGKEGGGRKERIL